jgi:hypothetical protein
MNKNQKLLKIIVFVLILGFYASFLFVKIETTSSDNDAGLYISDGRLIWQEKELFRTNPYSFVETAFPIVNHHWLSSVSFYLVDKSFGFDGLTVFKSIILLSAFSLLFWVAKRKTDFWLVAAASLPTILILTNRVRIRPEMFSYLFIALFLYFLIYLEEHPESRKIYWLIPLQALWVNFHIFFFVGIALVGGFIFEKIVLNFKTFWRDKAVQRLLIILPILVMACFVNPNGLDGVLAPMRSHSYDTFTVNENQPLFNLKANFLTWDILGSAFVPMVIIFLVSLFFAFRSFGGDKKRPVFYLLAGLGSAAAGLIYVRLITLFALMFLPAASGNFNGVYLKIRDYLSKKWPNAAKILSYILISAIIAIFPFWAYRLNANQAERGYKAKWGVGLSRYSDDSAQFFRENNLKGPIFNDYDIGGYIVYHFFPKEKVFVDNNGADSYPVEFFNDIFMPALSDEIKWKETEEKYKLNSIFISIRDGSPEAGSFLWRRLHDPSWSLVYADTYAVIFLKNTPENKEIISKFQITPQNVEKKLGFMLESDDVTDRIIAGRILHLVGRPDLSTSVMKKVVAKYPKNSWVWLYMGSLKAWDNNPQNLISSIVFLKNAVNMGEKTSEGYTWLGLAQFRFGQFEEAESSFQKALWLDPGRQDTLNYLNQLQDYLEK